MGKAQQDRLSYAIIQHLHHLSESGAVTGDEAESLAVARQCLSEALGVDTDNSSQTVKLKVDRSLQDVFDEAYPASLMKEVTKDEEAKATGLKDQGNELMKQNKYEEAIEKYTEALDIVPNAIFYCNRAAAYSKVGKHKEAVLDSKSALTLDPGYSKAYTRMGFAHLNMNQYHDARDCYQRACDLDPSNQSYKDNLEAVNEKIAAGPTGALSTQDAPPGLPEAGNFSQFLNNPAIMNMAQTMMSDPNMQNMMQNMFSQFTSGAGGSPNFEEIINNPAMRQLAESIRDQTPGLEEQLRNQMNPDGSDRTPPSQ